MINYFVLSCTRATIHKELFGTWGSKTLKEKCWHFPIVCSGSRDFESKAKWKASKHTLEDFWNEKFNKHRPIDGWISSFSTCSFVMFRNLTIPHPQNKLLDCRTWLNMFWSNSANAPRTVLIGISKKSWKHICHVRCLPEFNAKSFI